MSEPEIGRCFFKIAGNSAKKCGCAVIVELLWRINVDRRYFPKKSRYSRQNITKKTPVHFLVLMQKDANAIGRTDFRRRKTKDFGIFCMKYRWFRDFFLPTRRFRGKFSAQISARIIYNWQTSCPLWRWTFRWFCVRWQIRANRSYLNLFLAAMFWALPKNGALRVSASFLRILCLLFPQSPLTI